jgi:23S rRNA pseudouridine1911/1915/1917 synthase
VSPSFVAPAPGRLDALAASVLRVPRADVQRAIADDRVRVDGVARAKSFRLLGGERVEVDLRAPGELEPEPGAEPLVVRFEDPFLLVVSKPAGLVAHPTASRRTGTLVNRLLALGVPLSGASGRDRPGIVHRLDAGTSGLMIVAKDDAAHAAFADLFRRHAIDRRYLALVRGHPRHDEFVIEAPLERRGPRIVARASTGKDAETLIVVQERFERSSLVEARPRTGRTHQIRVHLSSAGHPILGDRAYGGGGDEAARLGLERPFLHSWWIGFDHPMTGERIELEDPLPEDLAAALALVRPPPATGGSGPALP